MNHKRTLTVIVILVIAGIIITPFSIINISQPVIQPKVDPSAYTFPSEYYSSTNFEGGPGSYYNYTETGYWNLSAHGCIQTYRYFFEAFHIPQITIIDNRTVQFLSYWPFDFWMILANQSINSPFTSTSIAVNNISVSYILGIKDPMTTKVLAGSGIPHLYHGFMNTTGIEIEGLSWAMPEWLLQFPGTHVFYLNFTLTPYADIGPFKFSGGRVHISLEWNATVVQ